MEQTADSIKISADEYMEKYAARFYEWVDGEIIKVSPVHEGHDIILRFFAILLEIYFELRPIGVIREAPFVMMITDDSPRREPDLQVILEHNFPKLTATAMRGPADIVIEVVSPESVVRDHGEKFEEYEKGGVPEYWIIDPLRNESRFYRINTEGLYIRQEVDANGDYQTPALPRLKLNVPTLWQDKLPGPIALGKLVQTMLQG